MIKRIILDSSYSIKMHNTRISIKRGGRPTESVSCVYVSYQLEDDLYCVYRNGVEWINTRNKDAPSGAISPERLIEEIVPYIISSELKYFKDNMRLETKWLSGNQGESTILKWKKVPKISVADDYIHRRLFIHPEHNKIELVLYMGENIVDSDEIY